MLRMLLICSMIALSVSAYGQTGLKPVHPDESTEYTLNERLSTIRSLESLATIESALYSFRRLTEAAANKIEKEKLAEIGNTGWEIQNLGFVNHVQAVKGTLLKQDYIIKKLRYELAQIKSQSEVIDKKSLSKIKSDYEKAEEKFQEFWNIFGIAD